jgi:hypothetical protein
MTFYATPFQGFTSFGGLVPQGVARRCPGLICFTPSAHKEMKKNDSDIFDRIINMSPNYAPDHLGQYLFLVKILPEKVKYFFRNCS